MIITVANVHFYFSTIFNVELVNKYFYSVVTATFTLVKHLNTLPPLSVFNVWSI